MTGLAWVYWWLALACGALAVVAITHWRVSK